MTTKPRYTMIPYRQEDRDIYDGLEFDPQDLAEVLWPGNMFQEQGLMEVVYLLFQHFVRTPGRSDVLVSGVAFICYDRSNLNVRIGPDCTIAIGVDAMAVRRRHLYLPWEAGKPPDFALEWASDSTAPHDISYKREIYESIGITEYWRIDATGGRHYGEPMIAEQLVNGRYERMALDAAADGSIRGYSPVLDLHFSWVPQEAGDALVSVHFPDGERMQPYSELMAGIQAANDLAEAALEQTIAAQDQTASSEERAQAAEAEVERLREENRRLRGE